MTEITILVLVLLAALAFGLVWRYRAGRVRATSAEPIAADSGARGRLLAAAGVTGSAPAVLHFSADWCGPCDAVRRVVAGVVADLADAPQPPLDIEIDIDAEPALAKELNVLSLPTTFIFDADGRERFRISGVPKATDLHSAITPLTMRDAA
ncbi:thiol-disulfide isomerase/thioredoxin [Nocardia transvalensis]|uniref:Thiol-disulfide isomerase/thioredoxin n=1 Tax=Nocardia transvalensis TaxID=37333 RepID=A0A7W9PBX4_9NOCA|nr:thioredoxin family protein [Nocardia transvalensis]MBB5913135.1 thiol-disulfide isomerase/thioredoxin [Nocardia transvalensis]